MAVSEGPNSFDSCVGSLDKVARRLRRRDISPAQYEAAALHALSAYLDEDRPDDDLDLLLQYARLPIEEHGGDLLDGDRTAVESFDRQLRALLHMPVSRIDLQERLEDIGGRIASGDGSGVDDLRTLCGNGWRDHPHLFMFRDNIFDALRTAFEYGVVDALVDAIDPTRPDPGPLASPAVFDGSAHAYAFDLLGTLATHGDEIGGQAVDGLVRLTGHLETAAQAAVRLPVWRLDPGQRATLLDHLEAIVELVEIDPFLLPTADAPRVPHILRSVLWLANDASHL